MNKLAGVGCLTVIPVHHLRQVDEVLKAYNSGYNIILDPNTCAWYGFQSIIDPALASCSAASLPGTP